MDKNARIRISEERFQLSPGDPFRGSESRGKGHQAIQCCDGTYIVCHVVPYSLMVTNRKPHSGKGMHSSLVSETDFEEAK